MTRNWKYTNSALQYFLEIPGIGNENTWSLGDTLTRALYCFGLWEWGRTDGVATPASSSLLTLCLRLWNGYLTKYFKPSLCYPLHGGQACCSDGPNMRQKRPNLSSPPPHPPTHPPANNWWQERRTPTQQLWLWEPPPSPLIDPGRENQPPTSECLKLGKLSSACQANSPVAGLESNSVNRLYYANCPAKNLTPTKICYFDFTSTLGIPKITIPL